MLYAILCYNDEARGGAKSKAADDALMAELGVIQDRLAARGKLGPHLRLMPTTAATTLRYNRESVVLDGPFAETKEQLLGFYVVECASLDEAIAIGRELQAPRVAAGATGTLEIRPVAMGSLENRIA